MVNSILSGAEAGVGVLVGRTESDDLGTYGTDPGVGKGIGGEKRREHDYWKTMRLVCSSTTRNSP